MTAPIATSEDDMTQEQTETKKGGWPKGKPRGPRAPLREPIQEQILDNGRVQVRGRSGEILTRKRTTSTDIFHIPDEIVPKNYSYQWNVMEVLGRAEISAQLGMLENGWRNVPAGRHKGMFMPEGTADDAAIIRDGLVLQERPIELTMEARAEEYAKAGGLMRDSQQQLGLTKAMPDGFDRNNSSLKRMERSGTSRTIAPAHDVARPRLPIAE